MLKSEFVGRSLNVMTTGVNPTGFALTLLSSRLSIETAPCVVVTVMIIAANIVKSVFIRLLIPRKFVHLEGTKGCLRDS